MDFTEIQRRREAFWEIYSYDLLQVCLLSELHSAFVLRYRVVAYGLFHSDEPRLLNPRALVIVVNVGRVRWHSMGYMRGFVLSLLM